ncbi:hypothetical protein TrCOL_g2964 [Triparma columacea]|uniref:FYVE-type domain-containing protein n=1 Tax=Triparma columacea TaxID=722753 RepID=A0A9W7L645_9STRA|nr:hypothetical protein TrCOL_g2964 [Triparma columacea]
MSSNAKMSLLEEAKARAAKQKQGGGQAAANPAANPASSSHDSIPTYAIPVPQAPLATVPLAPPPVQAPLPPITYAPQPQFNTQQAQSQQYPPNPGMEQSVNSTKAGPLSTKEKAKLARDDWKINESKLNSASVNKTLKSGGIVAPRWVPNKEQNNCTTCNCQFDWVKRKHHCRRCGFVFCGDCSSHRSLLPAGTAAKESDTKNPRRVCGPCHEAVKPLQDQLAMSSSNAVRENTTTSKNRYLNSPVRFTMGAEIRKAAYIIKNFHTGLQSSTIDDRSVPLKLIRDACGLAILTVAKGGFLWTGRLGTGIVISRRGDGTWSPPSAIMLAGCGFGLQAGGEVTDIVIVLTSQSAVNAFSGKGQVSLGAELSIAVGPLGRSAEGALRAGDKGMSSCLSYSHSKGLFGGISIEGSVISQRSDINRNFYGTDKYSAEDLLRGNVPPAPAAKPLYDALQALLDSDPTNKMRAGFLGQQGGGGQPVGSGQQYQQQPLHQPVAQQQQGGGAGGNPGNLVAI